MTDWRNERDDEGFPVCNEDRAGALYTDERDVVYVCEFIDGLGWSWRALGRSDQGE